MKASDSSVVRDIYFVQGTLEARVVKLEVV